MNKGIIILVVVLILGIFTSCVDSLEKTNTLKKETYISGSKIHEVIYEGCEYMYVENEHQFGITHKGNCKSKVHYKN